MYLLFVKAETLTNAGIPVRSVLTSYYKSPQFLQRKHDLYNSYTSPDEVILCPDSQQSMYCQLLCGLVERRNVVRLGAVFASAFLRSISFLEKHWCDLVTDIRTGQMNSNITNTTYFGVNLRPLCSPKDVSYTILPNMAYFEFVPLEDGLKSVQDDEVVENDKLVSLVDVKVGCYYELVVTTFAGKNTSCKYYNYNLHSYTSTNTR